MHMHVRSEKKKAAKSRRQQGSSDEDDDDEAPNGHQPADVAGDPFFQHEDDPFADPFFQVLLLADRTALLSINQ